MVKLMKLIKTIVGIVLLNKAVRSGLIAFMMTSVGRIVRGKESSFGSSNRPSGILALLEVVLASILSTWIKADGTAERRGSLDVGRLLADLAKAMAGKGNAKGRIIESNDYTVIDERR